MKKVMLIIMGFVALTLGIIGIAVPILPTTPFILVAASCFGASSPKLYSWLRSKKYFGDYIENYKNKTGIPRSVKIRSLIFLWAMLALSGTLSNSTHMWWVLLFVGVGVTIHIVTIKERA